MAVSFLYARVDLHVSYFVSSFPLRSVSPAIQLRSSADNLPSAIFPAPPTSVICAKRTKFLLARECAEYGEYYRMRNIVMEMTTCNCCRSGGGSDSRDIRSNSIRRGLLTRIKVSLSSKKSLQFTRNYTEFHKRRCRDGETTFRKRILFFIFL